MTEQPWDGKEERRKEKVWGRRGEDSADVKRLDTHFSQVIGGEFEKHEKRLIQGIEVIVSKPIEMITGRVKKLEDSRQRDRWVTVAWSVVLSMIAGVLVLFGGAAKGWWWL